MARSEAAPVTSGRIIGWPRRYDAVVAIITLGRARALRAETVELAGIMPGDIVLDVGCGTGDVAMAARARAGAAGRICGIDPAPAMIAAARRKAARARRAIDYRVAAVEALPFSDAAFDVVVSSLMLHHLPGDLKHRGLAEIRRVLRPGGRLLVVDFAHPMGHRGHASLLLLARRWCQMRGEAQDLPALVAAAGFTGVEAGATGFRPLGFVRGRVPA